MAESMTDTLLAESQTSAPTGDAASPVDLAAAVRDLSATLAEPEWLLDWRLANLERALELDWWTGKEETWRRTPRERLPRRARVEQSPPASLAGGTASTHAFAPREHAGLVHHYAGAVADSDLDPDAAAAGVIIAPLSQAACEHPDLVRRWLGSSGEPFDRYDAFGRALWTQGVFCYAPPGAVIEESLFHLITQQTAAGDHWHYSLIVADRESQLSLIEGGDADDRRSQLDEAPLIHGAVELVAETAARLQFASVQRWHRQTAAVASTHGRVGRDALIRITTASFGADLEKQRIDMTMGEQGGEAEIRGVFVGDQRQHIEHITRQHHVGAGAQSDLLIRGVLTDDSHAVQYGVIRIEPEGQQTAAFQTMRNLLLDAGAGADPIPVLEIEADDVKCSHAAAVGPVNPDQLFYLTARGIPPSEAERMVVRGFLAEIADGLPDAHMRDVVDELVERQLHPAPASGTAGASS